MLPTPMPVHVNESHPPTRHKHNARIPRTIDATQFLHIAPEAPQLPQAQLLLEVTCFTRPLSGPLIVHSP